VSKLRHKVKCLIELWKVRGINLKSTWTALAVAASLVTAASCAPTGMPSSGNVAASQERQASDSIAVFGEASLGVASGPVPGW
jgi:hypothetical protein